MFRTFKDIFNTHKSDTSLSYPSLHVQTPSSQCEFPPQSSIRVHSGVT